MIGLYTDSSTLDEEYGRWTTELLLLLTSVLRAVITRAHFVLDWEPTWVPIVSPHPLVNYLSREVRDSMRFDP